MTKSIMLKGVEVKIGDTVRFIDDANLYTDKYDGFDKIVKPVLGKVYTVRGFTVNNGFYLDEIVNEVLVSDTGVALEPGFGVYRFDPANPLIAEVKAAAKSKKKVNIVIAPEVIETLEEVLEFAN
jgi:hypothetical protein